MRRAIVVGGSNGIGLATTINLIKDGYFVYVLDILKPSFPSEICADAFDYVYCDLQDFDEELLANFSLENDISVLIITAGVGRVGDFSSLHIGEIEKVLKINALSVIKLLRVFYNRIQSEDDFFCMVMGSIAGWISSPAFSVYAASKAALCRCIESINIELELSNTKNRILNVSPGMLQGTHFYGKENQLELLYALSKEMLNKMFMRETLFIPAYEETYKDVWERYKNDPHAFGLQSYEYKKKSGRVLNEKKVCIGYLSGTFDLFHIGHLNLLRRAKKQCDYLIVGVHPIVSHKKKETFIPFEERKQIVGACKYVDKVVPACSEDNDAWEIYHFDKLFVGSDYKGTERFIKYEKYFSDKGVEIVYFDYTQSTSSTQIRNAIINESK